MGTSVYRTRLKMDDEIGDDVGDVSDGECAGAATRRLLALARRRHGAIGRGAACGASSAAAMALASPLAGIRARGRSEPARAGENVVICAEVPSRLEDTALGNC